MSRFGSYGFTESHAASFALIAYASSRMWEHTTFRLNPIRRLRRTGLAAMITIYGARSTAEAMIARVRRTHDAVAGTTPSGEPYCASDPELRNWVQGTAAYGFLQAYHAYVQPLFLSERDRYYAEGVPGAALYGATSVPTSEAELEALFHAMRGRRRTHRIRSEREARTRGIPAGLPVKESRPSGGTISD